MLCTCLTVIVPHKYHKISGKKIKKIIKSLKKQGNVKTKKNPNKLAQSTVTIPPHKYCKNL